MNNFLKIREWMAKKMEQKNKTDFLVLILLGVLVMIIAIPAGNGKKKETASRKTEESLQEGKTVQTEEDYRTSLENQLEALIRRMEGAGESKVMITLADEGQEYVDKDTVKDEKKSEQATVVYDSGEGNAPYIVRRERPKIEGVVVVSEGGSSPRVVTEISDAVMSLFNLEAHKVIVVPMETKDTHE